MTTTSLTVFSTSEQVRAASMAALVAFYNQTAPKQIKKFETREKGIERCLKLIKPEGVDHSAAGRVDPEKAPKKVVAAVAKAEPARRKDERKPSDATVTAMTQIAATVTKGAKKPAAKPKAKPASKRPVVKPGARGKALFTEDSKITVLTPKGENPKKGTAAERFSLYRSGMTVAAYLSLSGQRRDIVWDMRKGWISVGK